MKAYILLWAALLSAPAAYAGEAVFDISPYKEQCGGEYYAQCDSEELNQVTIFRAAEAEALAAGKTMILIMGAEWCHPCRMLDAAIAENEEAFEAMAERFLIVQLSADPGATSSSNQLMDILDTYVRGYPTIVRLDPLTRQTSMTFVTNYQDPEAIMASMTRGLDDNEFAREFAAIESIGGIPISVLDVPLDLEERFGQYPYFKSGGMIIAQETESDRYVNAGLARYHAFHYIDAARAFKQALDHDEDNGIARAFLSLAISQLGGRDENASTYVNYQLSQIDFDSLSEPNQAWVNMIKAYIFNSQRSVVQNLMFTDFTMTPAEALEQLLVATDRDQEALTLGHYLVNSSRDHAPFSEALRQMPDHMGAHHYLVHYFEFDAAYLMAEPHAQQMSTLAADSAHAQHMYGHLLPVLQRWDEAREYFQRAAEIHETWAEKYGFEQHYDWHYSHNLDLIGATYVGLGQAQAAMDAFAQSCPFDQRACEAQMKMAGILGQADQVEVAKNTMLGDYEVPEEQRLEIQQYFDRFRIEANLADILANDPERLRAFSILENRYFEPVDGIIQTLYRARLENVSYATQAGASMMSQVREMITFYTRDRLNCASFDGWGKGMLDIIRIYKVAKTLGFNEEAASLAEQLQNRLAIDVTTVVPD